jgi:hypothetical protein
MKDKEVMQLIQGLNIHCLSVPNKNLSRKGLLLQVGDGMLIDFESSFTT